MSSIKKTKKGSRVKADQEFKIAYEEEACKGEK
jgi:hypothetical protein